MWIEVEGLLNGETVFGSGRWRDNAIEADEQVRRYEGIAERPRDGRGDEAGECAGEATSQRRRLLPW